MNQIRLADHRTCPSTNHGHVIFVRFASGQTDDRGRGASKFDQSRRFNPTDRGQMDVYESHGRLESDCVTYGIFTMPCICNDRKVWISLQYLTQELSHDRMVINDENINHKCSRLGNLDGRGLSLRRGIIPATARSRAA